MSEVQEVISVAPVAEPEWGEAIRFLEQAVKAGCQETNALYLLAMAYKHQNRSGEARQMLAKIANPDANVLLTARRAGLQRQGMGQRRRRIRESLAARPRLLPRRLQPHAHSALPGAARRAVEMLDKLLPLAPSNSEHRFLSLLRGLLGKSGRRSGQRASLFPRRHLRDEEQRLLDMIVGLSQFDVVYRLLAKLVSARPNSESAFRAYIGALAGAGEDADRPLPMERCGTVAIAAQTPAGVEPGKARSVLSDRDPEYAWRCRDDVAGL